VRFDRGQYQRRAIARVEFLRGDPNPVLVLERREGFGAETQSST
jgi:hypothetical protein